MGPYTAAHTIHDECLEGKLVGKVIVITGASSGIGLETARALSVTGATLFLTVRDLKKAEEALVAVLEPSRVSLIEMDNASFSSIRSAAKSILEKSNDRVNILVANAGIMGVDDLKLIEDGHELHFATNHLGHFLLFQLLKPALLASSKGTPRSSSRVVIVASSGHRSLNLNKSDNYNFQKGGYNFALAYSNSKLANVYMANEIDRRYGSQGLHATSVNPGAINTNISRHRGKDFVDMLMSNQYVVKVLKSPEQGAATTVLAAVGKEWEDKGGRYLEDCEEAKRGKDDGDSFGVGWVEQTYNKSEEERLWKDSLKIVGVSDDMVASLN